MNNLFLLCLLLLGLTCFGNEVNPPSDNEDEPLVSINRLVYLECKEQFDIFEDWDSSREVDWDEMDWINTVGYPLSNPSYNTYEIKDNNSVRK